MSDWVYALDACAAAGIIDYDAPADILGQEARYVGNPRYSDLPTINTSLLPDGTKMKQQPKRDGFDNPSGDLVKNPSWKKWLFGGLAAAAVIGTTLAVLTRKGKIKMPDMTKFKTTMKNAANTCWKYIKKPFVWIANKFKKTP